MQLDAVHGTLSRLRSELKRVMEEREAVLDERCDFRRKFDPRSQTPDSRL